MGIKISGTDSIAQAAREFLGCMGQARVIAFYGQMGAGKTTFIKALCEELGVSDVITSPTFAIVNEYSLPTSSAGATTSPAHQAERGEGGVVYHFDFYRIKQLDEVYDMGYEEYFYSGNLCFIEWPELIETLLPDDALRVSITEQPDGTRLLSF